MNGQAKQSIIIDATASLVFRIINVICTCTVCSYLVLLLDPV